MPVGALYTCHTCSHCPSQEFREGNFVVKRGEIKINQVSPDQSQEWLNGTGKSGGGIVGITKTPSALSRWALSYNFRSYIAAEIRAMVHMEHSASNTGHSESGISRKKKYNDHEDALLHIFHIFQRFNLFLWGISNHVLQKIARKDLVTTQIQDSLLQTEIKGQAQLTQFVSKQLLMWQQESQQTAQQFYAPIKRNSPATFKSLYALPMKSREKGKDTILKADRTGLQRLITAYGAGRSVDMQMVMQHELLPVPIALAEMNGQLRTGAKSILADVLLSGINWVLNLLKQKGHPA